MGFANIEFLGLLIFLLLSTLLRESISQYEWTCSAYDTASNRYYLPDFGGEASVHRYMWVGSSSGMSYVYPIGEIDCTGIVTDVEFCYNAHVNLINNPVSTLIFTLLSLNQNSDIYTVTRLIEIYSTPNSGKCSGTGITRQCCDIATLTSGKQFHLPAQNFSFGISIPSQTNAVLPGLSDMMYRVPSYITPNTLILGSKTNLDVITRQTLRTMWFHITPLPTTSPTTILPISTLTNLPTAPTDDVSSTTSGQPTTTMFYDIDYMSATPTSKTMPGVEDVTPTSSTKPGVQPITDMPTLSSMGISSSPATPSMDTTETSPTKTSNGVLNDGASQVGLAVGGAIGGVIAIILMVIVLLLLLMIFVFHQGRRSFKGTSAINDVMYDNSGRIKKHLLKQTDAEKPISFIETMANEAYSSVTHANTVDDTNPGHLILTDANQTYASCATSNVIYEEVDATTTTPNPIVKTHTNMAYGCLRNAESTTAPSDHTEGHGDVDYSYVDLPVTLPDNDYY